MLTKCVAFLAGFFYSNVLVAVGRAYLTHKENEMVLCKKKSVYASCIRLTE